MPDLRREIRQMLNDAISQGGINSRNQTSKKMATSIFQNSLVTTSYSNVITDRLDELKKEIKVLKEQMNSSKRKKHHRVKSGKK